LIEEESGLISLVKFLENNNHEWNGYSIGRITILLFGRNLFIEIVIFMKIVIFYGLFGIMISVSIIVKIAFFEIFTS
jgi:hypothetical protein